MVRLKPGVEVRGLKPEMALAALIVAGVYSSEGHDCTITSGRDGQHMRGSRHYWGHALDFRTRNVPNEKRPALAEAVREALGGEFDVVLESTHLHVEFDPA
jgi:hypothetical protein